MAAESAGLMIWRRRDDTLEVLLVHPGGPYWQNRDAGAWSIPKGEIQGGEEPLATAVREVEEEIGHRFDGPFEELQPIRQRAGKLVRAWAVEGDPDVSELAPNTFEVEWPPNSGRRQAFPEIDQARFFALSEARERINPAQVRLLDELRSRKNG